MIDINAVFKFLNSLVGIGKGVSKDVKDAKTEEMSQAVIDSATADPHKTDAEVHEDNVRINKLISGD